MYFITSATRLNGPNARTVSSPSIIRFLTYSNATSPKLGFLKTKSEIQGQIRLLNNNSLLQVIERHFKTHHVIIISDANPIVDCIFWGYSPFGVILRTIKCVI